MAFDPREHLIKIPRWDEKLKKVVYQDYLEAKWRLVWFKEECPDWTIETYVTLYPENGLPQASLAKAIIRDPSGEAKAIEWGYSEKYIEEIDRKTQEKRVTVNPKFVEKSVTTAIARALALLGYGTQYAKELEEGQTVEEISDSPVPSKQKTSFEPEPDQMITSAQKELLTKLLKERPETVNALLGNKKIEELTKEEAHNLISQLI